jgi:hypothetical protein
VITLIMLAVITFMTVTFLVLSHRERGAVTTTTDQATAKLAADSALARAESEILSHIIGLSNDQHFDLTVSTNFINGAGYDPANNGDYRTNVNYSYLLDKTALGQIDLLHVLTNLLLNPRPPVIITNPGAAGGQDFRFYLDLNRNGKYETNGFLPAISPILGSPFFHAISGLPTNQLGNVLSNQFVGDPEWIGVLEYPNLPHSADNKFVSRYAYVVAPAGKTLDVNYIHNEARSATLAGSGNVITPANEAFTRNQGVGTWEINLAAFLADLNTNQWYWNIGLQYTNLQNNSAPFNSGYAFDDARALLRYRYGSSNFLNLSAASVLFTNNAVKLRDDNIDEYSDGPLMGTNLWLFENPIDPVKTPWSGSDTPNHYFTPGEFFDDAKSTSDSPPHFVDRLSAAGAQVDSYNRYTFYRMLAQLGTDSEPERDKININYANADANGNLVVGMETNLLSWNPSNFFNVAADRLLRTNTSVWLESTNQADRQNFYLTFGISNSFGLSRDFGMITNAGNGIPIFSRFSYRDLDNVLRTNTSFGYTPGMHRLLQVMANVFDAANSNNVIRTNLVQAPTVWRPIFRRNPGNVVTNVFIVGYKEVVNFQQGQARLLASPFGANPFQFSMVDLENDLDRQRLLPLGLSLQADRNEFMVQGIPLVIGAKKGLPNFNQFVLQNAVTVTRKLNFHRLTGSPNPSFETNQLYTLSITNAFGAQAWNSYLTNFSRPQNAVTLTMAGDVLLIVTNEFGTIYYSSNNSFTGFPLSNHVAFLRQTNITDWPAFVSAEVSQGSFITPLMTNYVYLPETTYLFDRNMFVTSAIPGAVDSFPVPHWWLYMKIQLRYMLVDNASGRVLDYANLKSSETPINIMQLLAAKSRCDDYLAQGGSLDEGGLWCTNRYGNPYATNGPNVVENIFSPTYGIINQIEVSSGQLGTKASFLWQFSNGGGEGESGADNFYQRLAGSLVDSKDPKDIDFSTPFNPTRKFSQQIRWAANDPLVHYTIPDLIDQFGSTNTISYTDQRKGTPDVILQGTNVLSKHFRPWPSIALSTVNNPEPGADPNTYNIAVKDPLITRSDDWQFPTTSLPNVGWLGRVHRGSPWQTIYLKASDDIPNYPKWSGDTNGVGQNSRFGAITYPDAYFMGRPANDRLLFDIFTTAIHENATRGQLSVNQTNLAAWSAVLSGVNVVSNWIANGVVNFTNVAIQPAGVYQQANPPPVVRIVAGINNARLNGSIIKNQRSPNFVTLTTNVFLNQVFAHKGDLLAAPELTEASPFMDTNQLKTASAAGLTDTMLEAIPQQIMSLLNLSHSPRFVIYAYGQTLHPANNSIYTGTGFRGLCTNYQVTAETATRAVVHVEGPPSSPHLVIEQFNVLPPD